MPVPVVGVERFLGPASVQDFKEARSSVLMSTLYSIFWEVGGLSK